MFDPHMLLHDESAWAIETKRKSDIRDDDTFPQRIKIVGPNGEIARTPLLTWRSEAEKYRVMAVVSECCKLAFAQAVVVTTDTRYLLTDEFSDHFGIARPTEETMDAWMKERFRVMKPYNHYMGNLPRHLFAEMLTVVIYGPRIKRMATVKYTLKDTAFAFEPVHLIDGANGVDKLQLNMIPAWWD